MTETMLAVSPGAAISLMVAVLAIVIGFGKLLVMQFERRMKEREDAANELRKSERTNDLTRLTNVERSLERESGRIGQLLNRVETVNVKLPLEYVRREDWIRFSATIDAKLDRLAEMMHNRLPGGDDE